MTMIKLSNDIPFVNTKRMFVAFPNFNGEHIFDLSDYDILIYYYKLFALSRYGYHTGRKYHDSYQKESVSLPGS